MKRIHQNRPLHLLPVQSLSLIHAEFDRLSGFGNVGAAGRKGRSGNATQECPATHLGHCIDLPLPLVGPSILLVKEPVEPKSIEENRRVHELQRGRDQQHCDCGHHEAGDCDQKRVTHHLSEPQPGNRENRNRPKRLNKVRGGIAVGVREHDRRD